MNYNEAMEKLKRYGQEHVLKYYAELPDEQRNTLIEQIDRTDFTVIGQAAETGKRGTIAPIKAMTIPEIDMGRERFERIGMEAVKAGKLGAVLLAGEWVQGLALMHPRECTISESASRCIFSRDL